MQAYALEVPLANQPNAVPTADLGCDLRRAARSAELDSAVVEVDSLMISDLS